MTAPIALPIIPTTSKQGRTNDTDMPSFGAPNKDKFNLFNNFINGTSNLNGANPTSKRKLSLSQYNTFNNTHALNNKTQKVSDTIPSVDINYLENEKGRIQAIKIPKFTKAKHSTKPLSIINAFAANSTQGLVRSYNEDRVSILINVLPDPNRASIAWPKCYLFAVYDGHGGSNCADFLRDNLHKEILQSEHFPGNPKIAMQSAIYKIEKQFCNYSLEGKLDHSGSCLSLVLLVGMNDK